MGAIHLRRFGLSIIQFLSIREHILPYLTPRIRTEKHTFCRIGKDKKEDPLLSEDAVRHEPEDDEIERRTDDKKHRQIPYYPLYVYIVHRGEVILAPLSVLAHMTAKHKKDQRRIEHHQLQQIRFYEIIHYTQHDHRKEQQHRSPPVQPPGSQDLIRIDIKQERQDVSYRYRGIKKRIVGSTAYRLDAQEISQIQQHELDTSPHQQHDGP